MSKGLEALKHLYAKLSCKSSIEEINENLQEYDTIEKELKESEKLKQEIEILHFIRDTFSMRNALLQVCDKNSKVLPERKRLVREYLLKEELL